MKALFILGLMALPVCAWADLTIFDVRKNLPMSDQEKVYRDFYINGGSEAGIAAGMVITVQRRLPLYDSYQNRSAGDLELKVAKIKIIHAQKGLAVARLHTEFTRENAPILEDNFIMVGDRLDLTSATTDKEGKGGSDKNAEAEIGEAPKTVAVLKTEPQIVVNSVELSSEVPVPASTASAKPAEPEVPNAVDHPVLQ